MGGGQMHEAGDNEKRGAGKGTGIYKAPRVAPMHYEEEIGRFIQLNMILSASNETKRK
jgi:hypothetical protein